MIIRLDKFLAESGIGSRKEVKEYCKKSLISVNGQIEKSPDMKIDTENDVILYNGNRITYEKYKYYMLNKPAGVISATTDKSDRTVIDLLKDVPVRNLFPVGRLDKDTVGLLLITNNGDLAHRLLSPQKHVDKTYHFKVSGKLTEEMIEMFKNGLVLADGTKTRPAKLEILLSDEISEGRVTITEGKYHQVKRMMASVGLKIVYLKRLSMGPLKLDESLLEGEFRELTPNEIEEMRIYFD